MTAARTLLWRAVGMRRRDVVAASLLYTGHQVGESLVPVLIGAVLARAIAPGGLGRILLGLGLLGADFLLLSLCYRLGARASMRAKQGSGHVVRLWLTERAVDPGGGLDQRPGELLMLTGSDAARVGAFAGMVAATIAAGAALLVSTLVLLRFSPLLAGVSLVGTAALLFGQNRASASLRRRSALEQQHGADATAMAEDLIRGLRVIKGLGAERAAVAGYLRSSRQALAASRRSAAAQSVLAASAALISGMYLAVVVGVGGWLALSGHLGLGPLVSALGLAQFVLGPMRTLGGAGAGYARAVASAGRIQDVLRRPSAVVAGPGVAEPEVSAGIDVRFDDVDLPTTHTANGCRASFTVPARQLTGLVIGDPVAAGAVGALLARERDPGSGAITVAGAEIAQWSLGRLRELVLVAPHAGALFEGSVGENIAVRARDDTAVRQATWAAFADQVIDTLPEREHTAVGDRGQSLSGGQRQRVALARALAADAPVLVLQDPTTSVDAVTEDRIAARLAELRAGRTTLLITSSPALLARCDRVIVLDGDGRRAGPAGRLATLADRSGGTNR